MLAVPSSGTKRDAFRQTPRNTSHRVLRERLVTKDAEREPVGGRPYRSATCESRLLRPGGEQQAPRRKDGQVAGHASYSPLAAPVAEAGGIGRSRVLAETLTRNAVDVFEGGLQAKLKQGRPLRVKSDRRDVH